MRRARVGNGRIVLGVVAAIVLVLALAQIFLPRIAADRVRARVGRYGTVERVSVSAWPAIELLWGDVGSVKVQAKSLRISPAQTAQLLSEARGVRTLSLTAASVKEGSLQLTDASLQKHGRALKGQAWTSRADVKAALGGAFELQLLSSAAGEVEVRVSGGLFGVDASIDAVAQAEDGKLVVRPLGFLLEGLRLTLLDNQHVYVEGVGASPVVQPSSGGAGYELSIWASLR